jgi:ABC-type transport system substrate-binding protein
VYKIFINEGDAVNVFQNFQNNDVNMILVQGGDSPAWGSSTFSNFSSDLHVFIFNQVKNSLTDIALHQAIACLIWRPNLNGISEMPLASFVLPGNDFWRSASSEIPCADISDQEFGLRLKRSIQILRSAGYKWDTEPSWNDATNKAIPGKGLVLLNGQSVPPATLVITAADLDQMQIVQADYIKDKANLLGIPMAVQYLPGFEELRYAVFSSHQYDMAIIGWRVSEYPGYLCDWFGDGNPFGYHSDRLQSACEALNLTTDLDEARKQVFEIQSVLTEDLPFIPLYSGLTYDAYRNISYPFPSVLGGLSGVYGAPSLAIPAP